MLVFQSLFKRVQGYALKERDKPDPGAWAEITAQIAALPHEPERRSAREALKIVRERLKRMDLTVCAWPPGSSSPDEDILYADTQRLVSAVLRVAHAQREVRVLKYVLKVKP